MPKKINDLREDIYNEYIKIFENNKNPLVEIEVISEKYQLSVERIIKFLMDYITETKNPREDYAIIFDNVLACGRKSKKFYDYLDELDVNFEYLKTNLTNYFIYYRPDILLTSPRKKQILEKDLSDYERQRTS